MERYIDQLSTFLASHFVTAASTIVALIGTSLLPFFRQQVRAFANWAFAPLNRVLPWGDHENQQRDVMYQTALVADYSFAEVFIEDAAGAIASYRKLSSYRALKQLSRYREGVSAEGIATNFTTMRGTIVHTLCEHGFFVSEIDLRTVLDRGASITNMYEAKLLGCFIAKEEYWTQEVAFPTTRLTIQIHFPAACAYRVIATADSD